MWCSGGPVLRSVRRRGEVKALWGGWRERRRRRRRWDAAAGEPVRCSVPLSKRESTVDGRHSAPAACWLLLAASLSLPSRSFLLGCSCLCLSPGWWLCLKLVQLCHLLLASWAMVTLVSLLWLKPHLFCHSCPIYATKTSSLSLSPGVNVTAFLTPGKDFLAIAFLLLGLHPL